MKIGSYVQVELNYAPAPFGRQKHIISGVVTSITDDDFIIEHKHTFSRNVEAVHITVLDNVTSITF
jgi:hypothetical protein